MRRIRIDRGRISRAGMAACGVMLLAGCAHKDAVQTVTGWYHEYEGGEIAKLRPPPPGASQPYPHVGLTPDTPPEMPSMAARSTLTEQLEAQRNFGIRLAAADGRLPSGGVASSPNATRGTGQAAPENDAPRRPPAGDATASASASASSPAPEEGGESGSSMTVAAAQGGGAPAAGKGEWSLPEVTHFAPPPTKPGDLPQIGDAPPPPPQFPGFVIPATDIFARHAAPAYALADPHGTLIRFSQASDQMVPDQEKAISNGMSGWAPGQALYITGFGDAASLSPEDQAASLRLALLRARVLAETVMLRHVPAADIHLAAAANGHFGRISTTP